MTHSGQYHGQLYSASHFPRLMMVVFSLQFIYLALDPVSREDWLLENVLVLVLIILVLLNHARYHLSRSSWVLLLLFLMIHEVGAHFTYAAVPYDELFSSWLGFRLNDWMGWERNHFDRLAHFSYGLLLVIPIQELCRQVSRSAGPWTAFVAFNLVMSTSMLFEWGAAWLFGGDLGIAYLGTQGDVWDAQKDMVLSILGASLALLLRFIWHAVQRHGWSV